MSPCYFLLLFGFRFVITNILRNLVLHSRTPDTTKAIVILFFYRVVILYLNAEVLQLKISKCSADSKQTERDEKNALS